MWALCYQAGLILGSSWRGNSESFDKFKDFLFSIGSQEILGMVTGFGYTLFVFLIGVRMDLGVVKRSGRQTLITGVLSIIVPALLGLMAAVGLSRFGEEDEAANLEFIAANQSYTSFAVVVSLLEHLKILNSEVGRLVLSSSIVADMVGLSFSFIVSVVENVHSHGVFGASIGFIFTILSVVIVLFVFRPVMLWIVRSTPHGRPVQDGYICLIILLVLVSSVTSNIMGRTIYSGPFLLGLVVPEGPPLGASLVNKLDGIITSVFIPLFITIAVIKADLSFINYSGLFLAKSMTVILITIMGKMAVCVGTSLYFKMSSYDALAFGLIMSSKGIVELAASSYFYDSKVRP